MMRIEIKMAFTHPEQLRVTRLDDGRDATERIPAHPLRPARRTDWNFWWEEIDLTIAAHAAAAGAILRTVGA